MVLSARTSALLQRPLLGLAPHSLWVSLLSSGCGTQPAAPAAAQCGGQPAAASLQQQTQQPASSSGAELLRSRHTPNQWGSSSSSSRSSRCHSSQPQALGWPATYGCATHMLWVRLQLQSRNHPHSLASHVTSASPRAVHTCHVCSASAAWQAAQQCLHMRAALHNSPPSYTASQELT
jgi:hypothetical protein